MGRLMKTTTWVLVLRVVKPKITMVIGMMKNRRVRVWSSSRLERYLIRMTAWNSNSPDTIAALATFLICCQLLMSRRPMSTAPTSGFHAQPFRSVGDFGTKAQDLPQQQRSSKKNCKLQLLRPIATRWNSLFLAVERIIRITREQGEGAITAVCSALKIAMFTPVELAFLAEYTKTMTPVAKALDVLQGETNVQMGWLVPTITILKNKLQNLRISSKFCRPLIDALLSGLEKRFEQVLTVPELITAAILVPKFKTSWTSDDYTLRLGLDYIKSHLKDQAEENQAESSPSSEEEDFFSSIKQTSSQENAKQLETYLGSPGDTMDVLKSFPAICNLSLRLNTALPASAACERLFSVAGLIFRPKRARIDHKNFENQLLLRLNRAFW
ncbi:uncharacterized protein LOC132890299 [Neoarius graeffei]|uniref:uncharacterized protein LOC132890299 n=1 Tax=Neoarius graeffei TaxID=443677 RepID=UPI00298C008B|nr:uncharacterized protein LOC132890299 [Neoarius graeffei]